MLAPGIRVPSTFSEQKQDSVHEDGQGHAEQQPEKYRPRTPNLANRLSSPGVLPVPPTPLLILAPNERRGDDQNFSKQTTHLYSFGRENQKKDQDVTAPALVGSVEILHLRGRYRAFRVCAVFAFPIISKGYFR
jgi:hypothetical protein